MVSRTIAAFWAGLRVGVALPIGAKLRVGAGVASGVAATGVCLGTMNALDDPMQAVAKLATTTTPTSVLNRI